MRALVLRAGHTITVHEATGTRVRVSGLRRGRPEAERLVIEWTIDMARAAGLLGRRNWQTYPRAMLLARATGDLCRVLYPDVVKGLGYVAETSVDIASEDIFGPPETAPEKTTRRALQRSQTTSPRQAGMDTDGEPGDAVSASPSPRPEEQPGRTTAGGRPSDPALVDIPLPDILPDESTPEEPPPSSPDVAPAAPRTVAPGPLKAIHGGLTKHLGTAATREERLALVSAILGRHVESTKDLLRPEGYRVLDYLDRFETGAASFVMDPETGQIAVHDLRTEPPPDEPEMREGDSSWSAHDE